ncbi:MAG: HAD family hydrolase [Patescibacteria group bacterium]
MFNTVLFDLDGTLVRLDLEFFLRRYIEALAPHFAGLIPPERFARELMRCTYVMVGNTDPALTNLDAFWESFPAAVGVERAVLEPVFDRFYAEEFPKLRPADAADPAARLLLQTLVARGYTPVIATNPLFPKCAILERLAWADCADFPYAYITCGEEMHFCKPNLEFFTELLARIGRTPRECLMVGNDMEEDIIAKRLGMATALVTDFLIDRGQSGLKPDWRGTLAELAGLFAAGREGEISG